MDDRIVLQNLAVMMEQVDIKGSESIQAWIGCKQWIEKKQQELAPIDEPKKTEGNEEKKK